MRLLTELQAVRNLSLGIIATTFYQMLHTGVSFCFICLRLRAGKL